MEKKNEKLKNNRRLDEVVEREDDEGAPKSDKEYDPENPPRKNQK